MSFSITLTLKYGRKALSFFRYPKMVLFQSHHVKRQWFLFGPVTPYYFISAFDLDQISVEWMRILALTGSPVLGNDTQTLGKKNLLSEVTPSYGLSVQDLSHLIMMQVSVPKLSVQDSWSQCKFKHHSYEVQKVSYLI